MGQATMEVREAGWIPGAMLAWAAQPLRPNTIHPDNSFVEDEEESGSQVSIRSQLSHNLEEVSGSLSYSHISNHCLCMVSHDRREGRGHRKEVGKGQQFASEKRVRKGCIFLRPFSWSMGTDVLLSLV